MFCFLSLVSSAPQFNQEDKIISDAWDAFGGPVENVEKSESQSKFMIIFFDFSFSFYFGESLMFDCGKILC